MEHIIQFGVTIDDEKIEKRIVENAEKTITADIKKKVEKSIFETDYYREPTGNLTRKGQELVREWLNDHSDKIIEFAAKLVADKVYRSKAWKEKYGEITE